MWFKILKSEQKQIRKAKQIVLGKIKKKFGSDEENAATKVGKVPSQTESRKYFERW